MTRSWQQEPDSHEPSTQPQSPPGEELASSEERASSEPAADQSHDVAPAALAVPSNQFTLSGALLVIGLFAMLLGPVVWLRVPWFAGYLGVGSLVVLAVISIFNDQRRVVQGGWWLLTALYLSALVALYIHS